MSKVKGLENHARKDPVSLLQSREYLSGIVHLVAEAIVSIDEEMQIVFFNRGAERCFGYSSDEVIGKSLDMLMPERFRLSHHGYVSQFAKQNEEALNVGKRGHIYCLHRNGHEFPAETSISKIESDSGFILTAFLYDITRTRKAESELHKFSRIVEQADESILITDRRGVVEYINPAFTRITGYSEEEVIGKTPALLRSGAQDESFYQQFWATISSGKSWRGSVVDRCKDGSYFPALLSVSPIHDELSEISHYVGIQQDMTEYKKLEEQFLQAQKMEAMGTLVGGIAHDFNNLLAAISGNVYLAKRQMDDSEVVGNKLREIEKLGKQAADMVRQLLTFAREDEVSMDTMSLNSFMKEGLKVAGRAISEDINLSNQLCSEELLLQEMQPSFSRC